MCLEYVTGASYLPGLWYLLVMVLEEVLADPESPKSQKNWTGCAVSVTARKVTSVFVGNACFVAQILTTRE